MCLTIFSPDIWPGEGFSYCLRICSGATRILTEWSPSLYRDDALSNVGPIAYSPAGLEIGAGPVSWGGGESVGGRAGWGGGRARAGEGRGRIIAVRGGGGGRTHAGEGQLGRGWGAGWVRLQE